MDSKVLRLFLLRILIASWMIPFTWTLIFALAWLMHGTDEAIDISKDFTDILWNALW